MENFFQKIQQITSQNITTDYDRQCAEKQLLTKHVENMFEWLTDHYQENIKQAAMRGDKQAVIGIYNKQTVYENIFIHKLLFPDNHLQNKINNYSITPLLDKLQEFFDPFHIQPKSIDSQFWGIYVFWD